LKPCLVWQLPEPCGNCDNCLHPPVTWDATEEARKALSCVYRTGQRFGVNYVVDVLTGKDVERIRNFGHDKISTYGIGEDRTATQWRSLFRQLIAKGLLQVDVGGHGSVSLTEDARPVLRGEKTLQLRHVDRVESGGRKAKRRKTDQVAPADRSLWEKLRSLRKELSEGKPAYIVVSGVGKHKLEKYGDAFVGAIREHDMFEDMDEKA